MLDSALTVTHNERTDSNANGRHHDAQQDEAKPHQPLHPGGPRLHEREQANDGPPAAVPLRAGVAMRQTPLPSHCKRGTGDDERPDSLLRATSLPLQRQLKQTPLRRAFFLETP